MRAGSIGDLFIGRESELRLLDGALRQLAHGIGGACVIQGEAGIGKTRLLQELGAAAEGIGVRVITGSATEFEMGRPFGPLVDALGVVPDLDERTDRGGSALVSDNPELQFRMIDRFSARLEALAAEQPLLLALDDLHWADQATLLALASFHRRLRHLPLLLVLTIRPFPARAELDRLAELLTAGGRHLALAPLTDDEVAALVQTTVGDRAEGWMLERVADAGGNPLLVVELVRALLEDGAAVAPAADAAPAVHHVPAAVRTIVRHRLSHLPGAAVEVLQLASVLGPTFALSDLAVVAGRSPVELVRELEPAVVAGLLVEAQVPRHGGSAMSFRHDLLRQAIYAAMPAPFRSQMHAHAGRALAAAGRRPAAVVEHIALGAEPGDLEAVRWMSRAAADVANHAPGVAADLLRRALLLLDDRHPMAAQLRAEMVVPLTWAGRAAEAEAVARSALAGHVAPRERLRLRVGLARALLVQGRLQECVEQIDRAAAEPEAPEGDRAELIAEAATGHLLCGDLAGADEAAAEALTIGRRNHDGPAIVAGLCTRAVVASFRGQVDDALALAREAVDRAVSDDEAALRHPHFFLAMILLDADGFAEARPVLDAGLRVAEELGTWWGAPLYHWMLAVMNFDTGLWDDAIAELEGGLRMVEEVGTRIGLVWTYSFLGRIAIRRGDLHAAREALASAHRELERGGPQFGFEWALALEAAIAEVEGDRDRAFSLYRSAWDVDRDLGIVTESRLLAPPLLRLALANGDLELAGRIVGVVEEAAVTSAVPSFIGLALRCRGLVEGDPATLTQALAAYRKSERVIDVADVAEEAAAALIAGGRGRDAVPLLDEAVETYERVGAVGDVARAQARLRSIGVRRGRRGPRSRAGIGWDALTDTERRVAALVSEGLTNGEVGRRLCISRRTVETHLSRVFAKVGVTSRTELARRFVIEGASRSPAEGVPG